LGNGFAKFEIVARKIVSSITTKVKKYLKTIVLGLIIIVIVGQFIRPTKNLSGENAKDISKIYPVPDSVQMILAVACNDCHSNSTRYPWYAEIQPIGWFLNNHIQEGKHDLNFSEFSAYKIRRQYRRFDQICEMVEKNEMPLSSYTLIHKDAVLNQHQKEILFAWAKAAHDSIETHTPADSLKMQRR
jgi:hypothetical protein